MNPETKSSNYIKDIENYFLKVTGKGLMLSGKDYNLINQWYRQAVSKETVLKAIQNAVEAKGPSKVKGISSLKDNIESYIKTAADYKNKPDRSSNNLARTVTLRPVFEKLNLAIEKSENEHAIRLLTVAKTKIEDLQRKDDNNPYSELRKIEKEFLESYFKQIDKKSQNRILKDAESKMPEEESRYFDEESRNNSLTAFRNEILLNELSLQNLFELK